jgi:cytochrome c peroxidase
MASLTSAQFGELGVKELARQTAIARASRPERDTAAAFGPKPARPDPALACVPAH